MKLIIKECKTCKQPIKLNIEASNRSFFRSRYGENLQVICGNCGNVHLYDVKEIKAEYAENKTGAGAVVGGIVGIIGGPVGIIIGLGLGAAIGGFNDTEEKNKVQAFNESY